MLGETGLDSKSKAPPLHHFSFPSTKLQLTRPWSSTAMRVGPKEQLGVPFLKRAPATDRQVLALVSPAPQNSRHDYVFRFSFWLLRSAVRAVTESCEQWGGNRQRAA
jgi:hypothetical protein